MNKFYLGSQDVADAIEQGRDHSITVPTLDKAINAAKRKIRTNSIVDTVIVVQIVAIVRKAEPPMTVEYIDMGNDDVQSK